MMVHSSDDMNLIEWYLDKEGISQVALASRAGVSQPTVSRAMKRTPGRRSRAHARLVAFIHKQGRLPPPPPGAVAAAVDEVWDGTRAHEKALAALIAASGELWPKMRGGG
jgi:hypothetical protein